MVTSGMLINQRYRLEDEIGRGGVGIVYSAYDVLLERRVAVKILHTSGLGSEGRANLLREAKIIAKLNHPNIITVYDAGEVPEAPYLVMELIDGTPLDKLVTLPFDQIFPFITQIFSALEYAHQQGIVHRDLKPGNILLEKNGQFKLMDFGLARSAATRRSVEGAITGTVFYMAPEQALGKEVDARSDLYSLGIILYELATGDVPFIGDDPLAVITQHLYAPVVPPRLKNETIPAALNELILRLLIKQPEDRPQSASEVLTMLDQMSKGEVEKDQAKEEGSILDRIVRGRMVARQLELVEVERLWARVKSGERQVLLISGEPGIGKTRFMQETVTRVEVNGGMALVGESYVEGGTPYAPFAQIARASLQATPSNISFPEHVLADLLLLAPDLRPRYPAVQPNPVLDPKAEQARFFENMVTWCQLICEKKPLLIVLEDAHWADSGSLSLFHHLVRRTRKLPVLFMLTYREVELDEQLPLQGLLVELNRERIGINMKFKRLDKQGTEAMLATLFAEEITPEFLGGIYEVTEGNPFFIEEVCKALVESGEVYYQDGRWQRPSMDSIRIPQSVRLAIQTRVGKLTEEVQEVLRLAAVIGREFAIEILQEASGVDEERLIESIEAAEDSQFIQELNTSNGLTYQFTHAMFPATLVEGIHILRRRMIHRRIAKAYQKIYPDRFEALAYHFTEGGDDQQAYTNHIQAGKKAAAVFANSEAEAHYLAALNLVESEEEKADLLVMLAEARHLLGNFYQAKENYLAAAGIFRERNELDEAAMAYRNAARAVWDAGDIPASLELALNGLKQVAGLQYGRGLAALLSETGREHYFNGQGDKGIPYAQKAIEIAESSGYADVLCDSLINLSILLPWGRENIELLEKAVRIAEINSLHFQLWRALNNLCVEYNLVTGEYSKARACAKRGMQAARQITDLAQELFMASNYVSVIFDHGNSAEARELWARVHQLREALPSNVISTRSILAREGLFLYATGQVEKGLELSETARKLAKDAQDIQNIIGIDYQLAYIYLHLKKYSLLKQVVEEGLEVGRRLPPIFEPGLRAIQAVMLCREGRVEQAVHILDALTNRDKPALAPDLYDAPIGLATAEVAMASQEWNRAWEAFASVVQVYHVMDLPFREAQALCDWAEGLQMRGVPEDFRKARELLQEALDIYTHLEVGYYVEQVKRRMSEIRE